MSLTYEHFSLPSGRNPQIIEASPSVMCWFIQTNIYWLITMCFSFLEYTCKQDRQGPLSVAYSIVGKEKDN